MCEFGCGRGNCSTVGCLLGAVATPKRADPSENKLCATVQPWKLAARQAPHPQLHLMEDNITLPL
jgi:hypothetical protein